MNPSILDLALVMTITAGLGIIARVLRQPLLLAYLLTGILITFVGFLNLNDRETFQTFSDLGIMFLLFLVGLEINYASVRMVGRASILVGLGQIIVAFALGLGIALAFGFSFLASAYIAIALTFSSTIIVVKLLSDKRDLNSLYGKITVGFLLVQDFIAILLLIFLSSIQSHNDFLAFNLFFALLKGITLFILMLALGKTVLPRVVDIIGASQELLFLTSLAWVFLMAALVSKIGFSIEIGGFLAGLSLANSSEHLQIASRIRPLRDFFIVIFFVILGSLIVISDFSGLAWPIIAFSLFVLIGNPLIVFILMGALGYRKRTSFLSGVTIAQISEFSLVLAALGLKLGHISQKETALIAAVGVITITLSTYLIMEGEKLFRAFAPYLSIFERKNLLWHEKSEQSLERPIILIGFHRTGRAIAANFSKEELVIVDFDPESIRLLQQKGYTFLLDDISDPEILERISFAKAKLIISTAPDFDNNMAILLELKKLKEKSPSPSIIVRAKTDEELLLLYRAGADYVLLPHLTAGNYLGKLLHNDYDKESLHKLKEKDLNLFEAENTPPKTNHFSIKDIFYFQ